jgi:hypothetical protein
MNHITHKIDQFSSISLQALNEYALMSRTDTKFVLHEEQLLSLLDAVKDSYDILEIDNNRMASYSSLYFDTPSKKFYHDHHNGRAHRLKIRMRKYLESDLCFLEVKQKDGRGNTNKSRVQIEDFETSLSPESKRFIKETVNQDYDLSTSIWNGFNRITLANRFEKERVTIDLNLKFRINESTKSFENLAIIEVKQEGLNRQSTIVKALRANRLLPFSISKYCIGMISLYDDLKYNRFKSKLLKINKISA